MKHNRIIYLGCHKGLLREISHGVKDGVGKYADMAAILFDRLLPLDCVVVPMPGHRGRADTMLDVAFRLSRFSNRKVCDALSCDPHESSYDQKTARVATCANSHADKRRIAWLCLSYRQLRFVRRNSVCRAGRNTNGARVCADNGKLLEESEMKKKWIVETHLGLFETWAVSAKKAIANIRFRLDGRQMGMSTIHWKAWEA